MACPWLKISLLHTCCQSLKFKFHWYYLSPFSWAKFPPFIMQIHLEGGWVGGGHTLSPY